MVKDGGETTDKQWQLFQCFSHCQRTEFLQARQLQGLFFLNLFNNISFLIELPLVYHCPRSNYNNGVRLWNIAWQIILRVCQYGTAEGGSRTRKRNFKARPNKPPPEIWGTVRLLSSSGPQLCALPSVPLPFSYLNLLFTSVHSSDLGDILILLYLCLLNFASINKKCMLGDIWCFHENGYVFFSSLSGLLSHSKSEETQLPLERYLRKKNRSHFLWRYQILLTVVLLTAALLLW